MLNVYIINIDLSVSFVFNLNINIFTELSIYLG